MVKFLVIRFSSIGDIVLTSPVVRCLKNQVDQSEVHYLTKPGYAEILKANPYIDKIHRLSDNQSETIATLKEEGFDYVIDLQNNLRSMNIKSALKRMYFTVHKLNLKKWILVNFKIDRLPERHLVDRYLDTLKLFDVKNDGGGLDYYIPTEAVVQPAAVPEVFHKGYIVLAIGGGHATKKLPPDQLIDLCRQLQQPVILVGGPEDKNTAASLIQAVPGRDVLNGCGQWSISQSASIIQQAACVITHDTGMMHIAAAFHKKIITIWGNTVPEFGMYAYRPAEGSLNFQVEGLRCRPCSKLGKKRCPKKHFRCMQDHAMDRIAEAANALCLNSAPQTDK
ncbi:MAG: glycosyltransferase family 9 protein [Bacteroidales bacterium]|nr:glycosyltransferase family 9 protein [Bacteroidales bacterium]